MKRWTWSFPDNRLQSVVPADIPAVVRWSKNINKSNVLEPHTKLMPDLANFVYSKYTLFLLEGTSCESNTRPLKCLGSSVGSAGIKWINKHLHHDYQPMAMKEQSAIVINLAQ